MLLHKTKLVSYSSKQVNIPSTHQRPCTEEVVVGKEDSPSSVCYDTLTQASTVDILKKVRHSFPTDSSCNSSTCNLLQVHDLQQGDCTTSSAGTDVSNSLLLSTVIEDSEGDVDKSSSAYDEGLVPLSTQHTQQDCTVSLPPYADFGCVPLSPVAAEQEYGPFSQVVMNYEHKPLSPTLKLRKRKTDLIGKGR